MSVSVLTLGDQPSGLAFQQWMNEYVYAMGVDFDFEKVQLDKADRLVLHMICLPAALSGFRIGTSFKRGSAEYWSTFQVDHASFISSDVAVRINALMDGLIGAVAQVPASRMPLDLKARFFEAATKAAHRLADEPSRHPRKPNSAQT
ncbi:MAG: hypothetical protein KGN34_09920 [Sphingomonadales bacterium]|nr:hypothetical protein [Sphingomonadales bacterium]